MGVISNCRVLPSAAAFSLLCLVATPAVAIQSGTHDGTGHPAVAWVIETTGPDHCDLNHSFIGETAVLVSPTVLLVTGDFASALSQGLGGQFDNIWVSFNGDDPFNCASYEHVASVHVDPLFDGTNEELNNLGALVLDAPSASSPATLPVEGRVDQLPTTQPYVAVAYGQDKGTTFVTIARRAEPASFRDLSPDILNLHLDRRGKNAPCFDGINDGGAGYVGSSTEIVGIVVDSYRGGCSRTGHFQRIDTASARSFIGGLGVPLP